MAKYITPKMPAAQYAHITNQLCKIPGIKKEVKTRAKHRAEQIFYFETVGLPKKERRELTQYRDLVEQMMIKMYQEGYVEGRLEDGE